MKATDLLSEKRTHVHSREVIHIVVGTHAGLEIYQKAREVQVKNPFPETGS